METLNCSEQGHIRSREFSEAVRVESGKGRLTTTDFELLRLDRVELVEDIRKGYV